MPDTMITLFYTVAAVLLYLYAFWVAYIAVMGVYRAYLAGRLTGTLLWLSYPIVLIGIVFDVSCQYTIATIVFVDWPNKDEYLVTTRLKRYMATPGTWRHARAAWICDTLLDIFDPTGNHC